MDSNKFDKFTKEAKQALVVAQEKAKETNLNYVGTEHILIGILSQSNSLGSTVLTNFGVSVDNIYLVLKTVGRMPGHTAIKNNQKEWGGLSGFAKKVIEDAVLSAHEFNHSYVGTEHLLYGVVAQSNTAATVILENMKVNPDEIKDYLLQTFQNKKANGSNVMTDAPLNGNVNPIESFLSGIQGMLMGNGGQPKGGNYMQQNKEDVLNDGKDPKTPALNYFTTDLTEECRKNQLQPVIGRTKEIERMVSILSRKTKNNPVLMGDPGVGKTAIVEGLAQAIVTEQVPDIMLDKKILSLSMSSVVAGTKYRGEFEEMEPVLLKVV